MKAFLWLVQFSSCYLEDALCNVWQGWAFVNNTFRYYDVALETSLTFVEFENMTIGLMPGLVIIPWLLWHTLLYTCLQTVLYIYGGLYFLGGNDANLKSSVYSLVFGSHWYVSSLSLCCAIVTLGMYMWLLDWLFYFMLSCDCQCHCSGFCYMWLKHSWHRRVIS